ncbi:MAG: hypothetical protein ACRD2J_01380 [Thermoanaerobaculia bacterium]
MKRALRMLAVALALPIVAFAQGYGNLDQAVDSLSRGFGGGEAGAIISGIDEGNQVRLQFPGLIEETGFFGRDQASYLLEKLFANTKPSEFEKRRMRKVSAEGQYHIEGDWTITRGGQSEVVPLAVTLQNRDDRWYLVSAQSASK